MGNRQPANFQALYPNATEEGVDLLKQLLVIEPEQRISASKALKHRFVNEFLTQIDEDEDGKMETQITKFDFGFESEVRASTILFF